MHTWTVKTNQAHATGEASTLARAWQAAHDAAADIVRGGALERLTLDVDGQQSTIHPADTGDARTDVEATLEVIESGRADIVAAHMRDDAEKQ